MPHTLHTWSSISVSPDMSVNHSFICGQRMMGIAEVRQTPQALTRTCAAGARSTAHSKQGILELHAGLRETEAGNVTAMQSPKGPGMVVHTYNPSPEETEPGGASLGLTVKPGLKKMPQGDSFTTNRPF